MEDIKFIDSLSGIDGPGKYYPTVLPFDKRDLLVIEHSYDPDRDREMYFAHVGNLTVMKGWNPRSWKTLRGCKQAIMDMATRDEYGLGFWIQARTL